eukprot:CAMPEP_0198153962 /NCGR_PEP_ID=MMETSP1443-20131203/66539_1 /TAXON_ID=186043 /ORGANISM="Entomoneis sp., Strain CCMP2396" /LENGTH=311 /DNA_ID=CAMNT_0043820497 /DNA_START=89 /DNA_END=1021 /DNA_ORIENTATION=+
MLLLGVTHVGRSALSVPSLKQVISASGRATGKQHVVANNTRLAFSSPRSLSTTTAPTTSADNVVELYQYQICPFCNKTKAFLDYAGLPYKSVEVNPLTKKELGWSKDYRKVPLAKVLNSANDTELVLKGSDEIVDGLLEQDWVVKSLESKWSKGKDHSSMMTIEQFAQDESARKWIEYTNNELSVLLYPNLCPSISASYQAFAYVNSVDAFTAWQKFSIKSVGSIAMYLAASRVKKKHNIVNEREALEKVLQKPVKELENGSQHQASNHQFLSGGSEPHLGDLAVFGALRGIQGTDVQASILKAQPVLAAW